MYLYSGPPSSSRNTVRDCLLLARKDPTEPVDEHLQEIALLVLARCPIADLEPGDRGASLAFDSLPLRCLFRPQAWSSGVCRIRSHIPSSGEQNDKRIPFDDSSGWPQRGGSNRDGGQNAKF